MRSQEEWPSGSWWRERFFTRRRSFSWTNRPRASTLRAASHSGTCCKNSTPTGQTVVLTTHYMEEADQLCARVAIMDHGKILALDTPANLKKSIGADTIVTVKVANDGDKLAEALKNELPGVVEHARRRERRDRPGRGR